MKIVSLCNVLISEFIEWLSSIYIVTIEFLTLDIHQYGHMLNFVITSNLNFSTISDSCTHSILWLQSPIFTNIVNFFWCPNLNIPLKALKNKILPKCFAVFLITFTLPLSSLQRLFPIHILIWWPYFVIYQGNIGKYIYIFMILKVSHKKVK